MDPNSACPVVCFGEVLWDILPSGAQPGGAPMNVAYHLNKLGTAPALITRIGLDDYGKKLVNMLADTGVTTEFFDVDYDHPTGLVYANTNDHHEVVYDIVNPSAWDFIVWHDEYAALLQQAEFFVYGSLTSRSKTSRETLSRLLEHAKTKVLDINLRPPNFHRSTVENLLQEADILKMNIAELDLITGWFSQFQTTEDRISLIQDRFDIETIVVTLGGEGAMVNQKGKLYRHAGFKVVVTDTIGSGDAFLAGFLHQLLKGETIESALDFACALGAFIATHPGACPDYDATQITTLINAHNDQVLHTIHHH
ncbi:carbohydrate kinase [Segetibacter sp. 3557_3]|uniref:carbohydrate kinase family protein n=1 Tax=Segetibacter sp. 3557_3 TaxID=2547429 RepID=UPI001058E49E|nr:carbohydrate kinase [Segetibacter sp. 3557_3]TDH23237.1 carbohydrate kinase [Segetibacter sp. 3557_3]